MTRDETKGLVMVIQAAYPNYHPVDKTVTINLWHRMLGEYDYSEVLQAAEAYIATDVSGFAPSVGQVIDKMPRPARLTSMEAWGLALKAIKNSGWESEAQFEKLPKDVQRAVGSASQLHSWATDEHFNEAVVMSHFIKAYEAVVKRSEEAEKIPAATRKLIANRTS